MAVSKKSERITIVLSPEELKAIDEWRRKQEDLPSRSKAIRDLVQKSLKK